MSTSSSFSFADARSSITKEDFLAFRSAWKALTSKREPLSAVYYAAHAIITGKDLYKAFSPSKRPHDRDEPFKSLRGALQSLSSISSTYSQFKVSFPALTPRENAALELGIRAAHQIIKDYGIDRYVRQTAVATGAARVERAAVEA